MRSKLMRLALGAAAVFPVFAFAPAVRAEDGEKPAKKEFDDEKIAADWKLCKARGASHCRKRAEYWSGKGTAGKDLFFLGLMWNRGEEYGKAAEVLTQFLGWTPPSDDAGAVSANQKNREFAMNELIMIQFKTKDYAKTVAAAEAFRKEFESSAVAPDSWVIQGHAHRMANEEDKAIEAFGKAAEAKKVAGVLDLVDVHLAAGRVDAAKEALTKYGADLADNPYVAWMKDVLAAVGNAAPGLDQSRSVGTSDAPTAWDKPTVLFFWGMQTAMSDRKLARTEMVAMSFGGKVNALGVSTYKKYNPQTMKVELEMTEDQEVDWYKQLIAKEFGGRQPPSVVVKQDWLDALKIRWENQITVVDGEGKLRYARLNQEKPWDVLTLEKALQAMTAGK